MEKTVIKGREEKGMVVNRYFKGKNVLVLAPHGDDGELGCGGTMSRLIEEGANLFYMCFSMCEESVPEEFPKTTLEDEVREATKKLGIDPSNLILNYYPVRRLQEYRQEILEKLIVVRKEISPEIIFMPSSFSLHQDHILIYREGMRAFKHYTCFGYDLPWDTIEFATTSFFKLDERHVDSKCSALKIYRTQKYREYTNSEFVKSLARVRGSQISVEYAEAFEMVRGVF